MPCGKAGCWGTGFAFGVSAGFVGVFAIGVSGCLAGVFDVEDSGCLVPKVPFPRSDILVTSAKIGWYLTTDEALVQVIVVNQLLFALFVECFVIKSEQTT